jgi:hypothetical protein
MRLLLLALLTLSLLRSKTASAASDFLLTKQGFEPIFAQHLYDAANNNGPNAPALLRDVEWLSAVFQYFGPANASSPKIRSYGTNEEIDGALTRIIGHLVDQNHGGSPTLKNLDVVGPLLNTVQSRRLDSPAIRKFFMQAMNEEYDVERHVRTARLGWSEEQFRERLHAIRHALMNNVQSIEDISFRAKTYKSFAARINRLVARFPATETTYDLKEKLLDVFNAEDFAQSDVQKIVRKYARDSNPNVAEKASKILASLPPRSTPLEAFLNFCGRFLGLSQ